MPLLLIGGIWVLLALFVTMGMASTTRPVSGGFVNWLKDQALKIPVFGGFTVEQIVSLDRWINNKLGKHFAAIEDTGVKWLFALAHYVYIVGYWSLYWPIALHHAITHQNTVAVPKAIVARTRPLSHRIDVAEAEAKAAAGAAHSNTTMIRKGGTVKEITRIERVAMPHAGEWDWIHKHYGTLQKVLLGVAAGAAGVALPHAPALPMPWGRTAKQIRRRLHRVEALLGVSAFAIMMARVLRLPNPRCLTRGGVGRMARFLCGAPTWLLDLLILGTVEAFIASDLCDFSDLLIKQARVLRPGLLKLVDVEDALINAGCGTKPADLKLPPLSLPDMPAASVLAA